MKLSFVKSHSLFLTVLQCLTWIGATSTLPPTGGGNYCGCFDCTSTIWNRPAPSLYGDQVYTCGERITYLETIQGLTQEQACVQVAGVEFPTICGIECNPIRCDGRQPTLTAAPSIAPLDVILEPDTELYCYPTYNLRKRWTNVWDQEFIVEVKEDSVPCGPGNNYFSRDLVDFRDNELSLRFKRVNGQWTGSEVRLVLPAAMMPFHYGTYSFHIKSIQHRKNNGALINNYLPPSLVLGMFTWDATERFELRENYNHEVDIELSRWNFPENTDANFLVQPPELPQYLRFHSGGAPGLFNQTGLWEISWEPNILNWSTNAGTGMTHSYSTSDAHFYAVDDRIQCLPANMEIRINLWNSFGSSTPTEMSNDEVVEVVFERVVYKPSNTTFVEDGGVCSKHCQCQSTYLCINGTCQSSESPAPTMNTAAPTQPPVIPSATCSAFPACSHLAGDCCPTTDGTRLSCCDETKSPSIAPSTPPPSEMDSSLCMDHSACAHLAGDCCPTPDGVMLSCCSSSVPPSSSITASPSTAKPTVPPSSTSDETTLCSSHAQCAHLEGQCCPTTQNVFLSCCSTSKLCKDHSQCRGLKGACCPTNDGIYLDCCFIFN